MVGGWGAYANAQATTRSAGQSSAAQGPTTPGPQAASPATSSKDIAGAWQGTLYISPAGQRPEVNLRLVFKIARNDKEELNASWYSIDQGAQGIPMATVTFQDGLLKCKSSVIERGYEGKMSEDGKSITGTLDGRNHAGSDGAGQGHTGYSLGNSGTAETHGG